jgi:hypothetical protein
MFPESQLAIDLGRLDAVLPVGESCVVVFTSGATVTVSKELGEYLVNLWAKRLK